ncbi:hypothetical protein K7X08_023136 [Anisodus acutangulus]|uniref:Uncharacterized protein n=1 Tax=Anisodus acutangulus TaxID=402998 RepID=A0A9Q1LFS3_9SOLA|nr:hypothetical protein K7X08_023136 [Anisodus acutangulus]
MKQPNCFSPNPKIPHQNMSQKNYVVSSTLIILKIQDVICAPPQIHPICKKDDYLLFPFLENGALLKLLEIAQVLDEHVNES